ncbi:hypothetical protein HF086_002025 [Spodoptera exigua]|uniref:Uncharacterized protein n=1 Tax=Spodoptera exigua TaxID=7107 RepID=A0A922MK57_SPOEX|nr:hypothetical protein HF086_002025 [Spodoptera exigua]
MIIIYIDILLLIILLCLTVFMCGYCFYRINRMRQNGEIAILLRPTKVVFSHKKEGQSAEELRTVVAYQNPFTGDYCVHKSRAGPKGYVNNLQPESPDSGVSDEYEPLNLEPVGPQPKLPHVELDKMPPGIIAMPQPDYTIKLQMSPNNDYNSVNKTWNWNYKEYQI